MIKKKYGNDYIMMKKTLLFLFILLVLSVGTVSATNDDFSMLKALNITPFTEDTTVDIDGFSFNIPKGYGEDKECSEDNEVSNINGVKFIESRRTYENEHLDSIHITVSYDEKQVLDSLPQSSFKDGVKKTINNHEGVLEKDKYFYTFTFMQDKKTISISAKNETMISSIIM